VKTSNLTSSRLLTKNSSWQGKQSISHTTVTFYSYWMNMYEDFALNFSDCITKTLRLTFLTWNFDQKQHVFHPAPSILVWLGQLWLFPVSPIEDLQNCIVAIMTQLRWLRQNHMWCWAPSQNTTCRMHLKMTEALGIVRTREGDIFELGGGQ
jgi:hypothetical protein